VLTAGELTRRFPAFDVPADYVAVLQPAGGYLAVEPALAAMHTLARAAGADLHEGETVQSIEPHGGQQGDYVRVVTDRGTVEAGAAIVTAGPWTRSLLPQLAAPLRVTREVIAWFAPSARFSADGFPVFILESVHGMHYGIPPRTAGGAIKIAKHHHRDETVDPDRVDRAVSAADEALIRPAVAAHVPGANGALVAAKTCLYTMTPDGDFLIDRLPDAPQIVVASPCSGHGFKFAPVIGEILADLAVTRTTRHDISRFRLARFAP
jgi:sarcosine oxidase